VITYEWYILQLYAFCRCFFFYFCSFSALSGLFWIKFLKAIPQINTTTVKGNPKNGKNILGPNQTYMVDTPMDPNHKNGKIRPSLQKWAGLNRSWKFHRNLVMTFIFPASHSTFHYRTFSHFSFLEISIFRRHEQSRATVAQW